MAQQHAVSAAVTTTTTSTSNLRSGSVQQQQQQQANVTTKASATTITHTSMGEFKVPVTKKLLLTLSFLLNLGALGVTMAGTIIHGAYTSSDSYDNDRMKSILGCWIALTVIQFLLLLLNVFYMFLFAFKRRTPAVVVIDSDQQLQLKSRKTGLLDMSLRELLLLHFMRWISDSIILLFGAFHVGCVALSSWVMGHYYDDDEVATSILILIGSLICLVSIVIMLYVTRSVYKRPRTRIFMSAAVEPTNNSSESISSSSSSTTTEVVHQTQTENVIIPDHVHYPRIMHPQPSSLPSDHPVAYSFDMTNHVPIASAPMQYTQSSAPQPQKDMM